MKGCRLEIRTVVSIYNEDRITRALALGALPLQHEPAANVDSMISQRGNNIVFRDCQSYLSLSLLHLCEYNFLNFPFLFCCYAARSFFFVWISLELNLSCRAQSCLNSKCKYLRWLILPFPPCTRKLPLAYQIINTSEHYQDESWSIMAVLVKSKSFYFAFLLSSFPSLFFFLCILNRSERKNPYLFRPCEFRRKWEREFSIRLSDLQDSVLP